MVKISSISSKFPYKIILSLNDFCVGRKIKVYIKSIGRYIYLKFKDSFLIVSKQFLFSYKIIFIGTGQFICASGEVFM